LRLALAGPSAAAERDAAVVDDRDVRRIETRDGRRDERFDPADGIGASWAPGSRTTCTLADAACDASSAK
jgi:hypothetical protein